MLALVVDQVGRRSHRTRHLDQAVRVRRVGRPDDQDDVRLGGEVLHGLLAVLRRVADVVAAAAPAMSGNRRRRIAMISFVSSTDSVVWRQVRDAFRDRPTVDRRGFLRRLHQDRVRPAPDRRCRPPPRARRGRSAGSSRPRARTAAPRRCTFVTSGHVASIDREPASLRVVVHLGGDAVRGEHHTAPSRDLVARPRRTPRPSPPGRATTWRLWTICLRTYTGAPNRSQGPLHRVDGALDAGAVAARVGDENPFHQVMVVGADAREGSATKSQRAI